MAVASTIFLIRRTIKITKLNNKVAIITGASEVIAAGIVKNWLKKMQLWLSISLQTALTNSIINNGGRAIAAGSDITSSDQSRLL